MKETRSKRNTGKKPLTLLLLVATVALSLATITTSNLSKPGITATIESTKESASLRAANSLSTNWVYATNSSIESSPVIGDVDSDGNPEILIGSDDGGLYCLEGVTGGLRWVYSTGDSVASSPVIFDVDKDGHNEVIFGSNDRNIYCLNSSGQPKWKYTTGGAVISSPVIAPLDGDSSYDIVIGSCDNKTYCLNCTGGLKWNYTSGGSVLTTPALDDLDGDGRIEVVIGSWDKNVYCLDETGKVKWNYTTGDVIYSSPAIGDLDRDAQGEVVIGSCDKNIYCLNETGGLMWTYTTGDAVRSSPAISDVDNDNNMEVIIGSNDHNIYCLNGTGGLKWDFTTGGIVSCCPAVTDVDGDNQKEVVVGTWSGEIICLNRTGAPKFNYTILNGAAVFSSPAIADVNGDGRKEIVVGSNDHWIYCFSIIKEERGTLIITVSDSSSGIGVQGVYVYTTEVPTGQPSLSNITAGDGSVAFRDILTGEYYFTATKQGYSDMSQYIYVGNGTTTAQFSLTNMNVDGSSFAYVAIAGMAVLFLVILVVRRLGGGVRDDGGVPTDSYESTPEDESEPVALEEPSEHVLSPKICPYCGAAYVRADASYCWNCGAGLVGESEPVTTRGQKRRPLAIVGRCMVCGLDVNKEESVVRCPFCGNIAHRTHLLEWLHIRDYCPECYHHLDERDLGSIH